MNTWLIRLPKDDILITKVPDNIEKEDLLAIACETASYEHCSIYEGDVQIHDAGYPVFQDTVRDKVTYWCNDGISKELALEGNSMEDIQKMYPLIIEREYY